MTTTRDPLAVLAVRISPTIAGDYTDRAPAFVPDACWLPGIHTIRVDDAKYMRSDAEDFASGLCFDEVRPGVRRAYAALAKQLDALITPFTPGQDSEGGGHG